MIVVLPILVIVDVFKYQLMLRRVWSGEVVEQRKKREKIEEEKGSLMFVLIMLILKILLLFSDIRTFYLALQGKRKKWN